jgi:hypothetical protein
MVDWSLRVEQQLLSDLGTTVTRDIVVGLTYELAVEDEGPGGVDELRPDVAVEPAVKERRVAVACKPRVSIDLTRK